MLAHDQDSRESKGAWASLSSSGVKMRMAMGMEVDSLRHAARPRVRGRQFASAREAALPGGDEALGGHERLPLTRGKEGDPRASFPQGAATRSLARPTGSGYQVMCRAGATPHCARVQLTCLPAAASGRVLSGSPLKPA